MESQMGSGNGNKVLTTIYLFGGKSGQTGVTHLKGRSIFFHFFLSRVMLLGARDAIRNLQKVSSLFPRRFIC
jgi:hypothetical protein